MHMHGLLHAGLVPALLLLLAVPPPPSPLPRAAHNHAALLLAAAGPSEDEERNWDDDRLVSLNLDGPDWNERNLVPVQCVRMNGEEMMVYTMYDNDRHEYDVAPAYDDDANGGNNANYGGDDDAAAAKYNYNYANDDYANAAAANGGDDDANANNNAYYTDDYSAAADDQYYDAYYTDDAAAAATDDDAAAAATDDASYAATDDVYGGNAGNGDDDAYANDDANGNRDRHRGRKLSTNFSYNKDARCKTQRGTFYAPLADFVRAYSRQRDANARYMGNRNRVPAAVQYLTCAKYDPYADDDQDRLRRSLYGDELPMAADGQDPMSARRSLVVVPPEYGDDRDGQGSSRRLDGNNNNNNNNNDDDDFVDYTHGKDVYIQVGCLPSTGKALAFHTYKDDQCKKPLDRYGDNSDSRAILSSIGAQNVVVHFGACHHCVVWPEQVGDDDDASHRSREFVADDDQFWTNHGHDSPLCATADAYRHRCGVKCRVAMSEKYNGYGHYTRGLTLGGKVVAWLMAASVGVCIVFIDRERRGVSTERDPLRNLLGGLRVGTPALCAVAAALVVLSVLLELMELKYAFWAVLVSACAMFWAYWWSLYRVGPRKGLLDGQMWLAGNEAGVLA